MGTRDIGPFDNHTAADFADSWGAVVAHRRPGVASGDPEVDQLVDTVPPHEDGNKISRARRKPAF